MKKNAFTLIEILIALCLFTLVLGIIYAILTESLRTSSENKAFLEVEQNARTSIERIVTEARESAVPINTNDLPIINPSLNNPTSSGNFIFSRPNPGIKLKDFEPGNPAHFIKIEYQVINNRILKRIIRDYTTFNIISEENIIEVTEGASNYPNTLNLKVDLYYDQTKGEYLANKVKLSIDIIQYVKKNKKDFHLESWINLRKEY
ncbi:MAG: prepilin-type N-terminal cleavage/methylation domain-containing protein [Armatimonadetes bacterium]|nr:prepilin-type N-terminal cleavage/methylation domain-containing protein [Armatimonadota bacterium]